MFAHLIKGSRCDLCRLPVERLTSHCPRGPLDPSKHMRVIERTADFWRGIMVERTVDYRPVPLISESSVLDRWAGRLLSASFNIVRGR